MNWIKTVPSGWIFCLVVQLALPLLSLSRALGQEAAGRIRGTVRSESGAPAAGVRLILTNPDKGMTYQNSPEGGRFEFDGVRPGVYVFTVSPETFAIRSPAHIEVKSGQVAEVTVTVEPASKNSRPSQPRQAEGSPSTAPTGTGAQIGESQLVGLPLNGRSYSQLATLQGSMSDVSGGSATRGGGSGNLTVSGGRSSSNNFFLDGTNIMDTGNQVPRSAAGVQLGADSMLEVQVYGVQYSAQYGRGSGGVLNSVSRSGTDAFHASLFEFFRNSKLDARNFFDRREQPNDPRLPPFKRNQFGFTMTGPLRQKRTYWMAAMEVMRDRQTTTDPHNILDVRQLSDVEVDPRVKPYLALYPPTNVRTLGNGFGVTSTVLFLPTNEIFLTGRVDHRLSDRDSVFGRYSFDDATSYDSQLVVRDIRTRSESRQQYLTLVESRILNPRLIAAFRFAYTRPAARQEAVSDFQIPRELYFVPGAPQFGVIQILGSTVFGPTPSLPQSSIMNSFQFAGDVILQRGAHSLKLGADIHRYRWDIFRSSNEGAVWSFASRENFLTLEDSIPLGSAGTTGLTVTLPGSDGSKAYRQTLTGVYLQDEYRLSPRFQVSLGVRYEFATLIHDRDGRTAFLADPLHDTQMQVGPYLKSNPSFRSFSPRVGITWSPAGATVFSAGFGVYYDQMLEYVADARGLSPPFYQAASLVNLRAGDFFPRALDAAAAQKTNQIQALIMDYEHMRSPTVLRYNASLRHPLPGNWRLQISYVGARGNHLYRAYEINQFPVPVRRADGSLYFPAGTVGVNPAFGSVNLLSSDAQSFYNSLQFSTNRNFGRGNSLQANYTYSKSIDDASNFGANNDAIQYGLSRTLDRAVSEFDIRSRLTVSYFYGFPFGSQGRWWKDGIPARLLGGWRLGGISSLRNGVPINLKINVRNSGYLFAANRPNLRPGRNGNPTTGVTTACYGLAPGLPVGVPERYFDPCAFDVPAAGTLGNNGRNSVKGPGAFTLDASLQRDFLLDSKRRLQFRMEVFNLTNRSNFRPFSTAASILFNGSADKPRVNPAFGTFAHTITTSRQIQFALRLSF